MPEMSIKKLSLSISHFAQMLSDAFAFRIFAILVRGGAIFAIFQRVFALQNISIKAFR